MKAAENCSRETTQLDRSSRSLRAGLGQPSHSAQELSPPAPALLTPPPHGWTRRLVNLAILGFLASQIAIPASYYLSHDEPTQERFSWRMFSSVDLSTWDARFTERVDVGGQPAERVVPMELFLQETHCGLVRKVQLEVVEKFMRNRLSDPQVRAVMFEARGTAPSGKSLGPVRYLLRRADGLFHRTDP